mgnify:FL=1
MELKIYDKSGALKLTASPNPSSALSEEVMGECSVSASFTHTSFVLLDAGDYIELQGVRYKMRSPYRPVQKNTQTYSYTAKFYAPIHDAEDTLMLYLEDGDTRTEFSFDGGPREHLQLWVDNMNRVAGAEVWSIGTVITGENKTIDYNNLFCWEAGFGSNGIAAAYNTELWADGYVINLCKAERGERVELGYLKGLAGLSQEENGDVKFFTRLFPLGSTRNIDATKYGHARLQLPSGAAYVDRNTALYGVKEAWEEASFSGIYPKYIGTVTSVRSEEKTSEEGRKYTAYYIKDSGMGFNPKDYEIPDLTYMLAFQTGDLAGRGGGDDGSFEVAWHEDAREWEIINVYPDDKTQIPGGEIVPAVGDTYIPWNFALPQEYVTAAEQTYAEAVDDYLSTYSFDPKKYSGTTDRNYIEQNRTPLMLGQNVRLLSDEYFAGGFKDTRIVKCVRKLGDLCQATVTCTDQIGNGWKTSVENQLGNLQYILAKQAQQVIIDLIKTGEGKTPSDTNVFSALRSLATFLRKDQPDATQYLLRLLGGVHFGEFASSLMNGTGGSIDSHGNAELETLRLRSALIVKEIILNRWSAQEGNTTFTEAGTIDAVKQEDDGTYTLTIRRRWEYDVTAFDEQDVCYGSVNDLAQGGGHYYDAWFRVLSVNRTANTLSVVFYPDDEVPGGQNYTPQVGMVITRRGNATNTERQGFWYISSYEGCICFLDGVTKPILEERNYAIIIGKLKRLSLFDNLPINYLHSYVYCRGIAIQDLLRIDYQGTPVVKLNDRGFWSLEVAQSDNPYTVGQDTVDTVWHYGCRWKCLVTGTTDEPRYAATGWAMIEGNPNFTIDIESENGWTFDGGQLTEDVPFTTLAVTGTLYNRDVTVHILDDDISWTRDTGNVVEDNAWAIKKAGAGKNLPLVADDLGLEFRQKGVCSFKCTATLRDGQETLVTENIITF